MISLGELLDVVSAATQAAEVFPSDPEIHQVVIRSLNAIDAYYLGPMLSHIPEHLT